MESDILLVDLKAQYLTIKNEVDTAIHKVLDSVSFVMGPAVAEFETAFANYIGTKEALGVGSGTSALHLSLLACGVEPGDEVITSTLSFFATAEAILQAGAVPVFVDINPETYNIDASQIESALSSKTKAIIPVHLYGQSADMDPIMKIAKAHNLVVIEDACQAHGAKYKGKHCGTFGNAAAFSFYPGKNLGSYGDGGAITSSDSTVISRIKSLRDHGRQSKYIHDEMGYGERLDSIQAAVLKAKLPYLDCWTELRRQHAKTYENHLKGLELVLPRETEGCNHVYHLYVLRTPHRDKLLRYLNENGVGAALHYPLSQHEQPAIKKLGYTKPLPIAEQATKEILSLPMYPELTENQLGYIIERIRAFFKTYG